MRLGLMAETYDTKAENVGEKDVGYGGSHYADSDGDPDDRDDCVVYLRGQRGARNG